MTPEQVAADFSAHVMTLPKRMRRATIDDRMKPGTTRQENAKLRDTRRRIKLPEQENEVLHRAAAYLSQANLPGIRFHPLVKELAAGRIPVTVTCQVLKLTTQPHYRRLGHPVTNTVLKEAHRANASFDAHRDNPEFGYRFPTDEARGAGAAMTGPTP
ncbi:hypothetical protein ACFWNT_40335 [Streptomyces sp. NPDC058409]|uniref:hypothetical protein n=1 Tax=Streptomyces sp. NPDC058409 TaxID=3346484 RepID=UPI0036644210